MSSESNVTGPDDTLDDAVDVEQIIPTEQPPMDDAAGGPQADKSETL